VICGLPTAGADSRRTATTSKRWTHPSAPPKSRNSAAGARNRCGERGLVVGNRIYCSRLTHAAGGRYEKSNQTRQIQDILEACTGKIKDQKDSGKGQDKIGPR